jgi:cyclopropane fatty-acyl-phospholipid synthase-like methyltransferase
VIEPPIAPSVLRNSEPILGVLRHELATSKSLLEIGSGTGQHAVEFAAQMPELTWQTSDLDESHAGILAHIANAGIANAIAPISLDVRSATLRAVKYDAVFTCNTAHIMSLAAVEKMLPLVATALNSGGRFFCYGPFRLDGKFSTKSNANFDLWLRQRDPESGIRDLEDLDRLARDVGLQRQRVYAMPANNLLVIWQKQSTAKGRTACLH